MARLTMPEECKDTPLKEIAIQLTPKQLAYANRYLNNGNISLDAYREAVYLPKGLGDGKTKDQIYRACTKSALRYSRIPLVAAYVVKSTEKRYAKAIAENDRDYEAWIARMGDLRDNAAEDGQYSPSIRAHELIGKADGHIDANRVDNLSRMSDAELVRQLAATTGIAVSALADKLAVDSPEATVIESDQN